MRVVHVDDEKLLMEYTVALCQGLDEIREVNGFTSAREALDWIENNPVDLALLDINMPDMNGLELAIRIKEISPDTAIIFMTAYSEYALDAFSVHASGYLMKPVTKAALLDNIKYVASGRTEKPLKRVRVTTFGSFDVFVGSKQLTFHTAKGKEILAYLVDRQGSSVTRAELAAVLWEDRNYDRKLQKQLDVYIRSLRDSLNEYGIADILDMQHGSLRVVPESFDCDLYRFLSGDSIAVNSYRGEYMSAYSWASITEGVLFWKQGPKGAGT